MLAIMVGLAISVIGIDPNSGVYRYTFGSANLVDGVQFATVVIGLFAISELLIMFEGMRSGSAPRIEQLGRRCSTVPK
jgi:putative tricarboxylic transport membrane protein